MTPDRIKQMLREAGLNPQDMGDGEYVMCNCAFNILHEDGYDHSPSMRVDLTGELKYFCFGCLERGRAWEIFDWIGNRQGNGKMLQYSLELLGVESDEVPDFLPYGFKVRDFDLSQFSPLPDEALKWLQGRGVSPEETERFSLRWDAKRALVVYPVWKRRWIGAVGRSIVGDRYHTYHTLKTSHCLGGWQFQDGKFAVIVEGFRDLLHIDPWVREEGGNTYCLNKCFVHSAQCDMLNATEKVIYLMLDNDSAGYLGEMKAVKRLKHAQILVYPTRDPKELTRTQWTGVKTAVTKAS